MKSFYYLSIFLIFAIAFSNCKQNQEYMTFKDFPVSEHLIHNPIALETPIMYPSDFVFLDSTLVILDLSGSYFLSFYNLHDFKLINHSIRKGRGPLEEESVFDLFNGMDKNELGYKTHSGFKTVKYIKDEKELVYQRFIPVCDSFVGVSYMLNDDVLGIPRISQNKEFVRISSEDCANIDFGSYFPDVGKKLEMKEQSQLLANKSITVKPDGSLFAASYHNFPIIRIFNSKDGGLISDARLKNNQSFPVAITDPNAPETEKLSATTNYFVTHSTNKYIYSSYSGKSLLDLQPNILQEGFKIIDFANEIHVFDWQGKPVKRINLDKRIFAFAVSPDDKTLIAIQMSDPETLLLYNLSSNEITIGEGDAGR